MKENFVLLFEYEKWATGRVLDAMNQLPAQDEKCTEWMAHILLAQVIWYSRVAGTPADLTAWDKRTFKECLNLYRELSKQWSDYCNKLTENDLKKTVKYCNTKGEPFENSLKDILTHVINHSTYHRGQIIAKLKGQLPALPSTDYILFRREAK